MVDLANFKEKYKIYIWLILGVLIFFIFLNFFSGEKARVRRFILQGKKAVESKNILTCANMISKDYQDKYGNDKQGLIYIAKEVFGYYKSIFVHVDEMEIELDDSKKEADVEIVALVEGLTQKNNAEKILEGEKGRFKVRLIKEDRRWQVLELEFFEAPITIMGQSIS